MSWAHLIILALLLWLFRYLHKITKKIEPTKPKRAQDMKPCAFCGVHVPVSEAIQQGEHFFCSEEHAESYAKQPRDED